jgi:Na+-transporting methylmalonyl-CoA/oxaloacetate decarboxylase gamma subunit
MQHRVSTTVAAVVAAATVGALIGIGIAGRSAVAGRGTQSPSITEVGHRLLVGSGVGALGVLLLVAIVVVGMATLVGRDRRELVEEQSEANRRRRALEQQRRAQQRAEARAAARAARRGARP